MLCQETGVQNKKMLLITVILFLSFSANASDYQGVITEGGIIHLRGSISAGACTVSIDSLEKTIDMGQFRSNRFTDVGSYGDPVAFNILLSGCSKAVSKTVGIAFWGVSDAKNPQVFRAGEGANASSGIGLAIFDSQGSIIQPNMKPQFWTPINDGEVSIRFIARYRATSHSLKTGNADVSTWFTLTYP